tara:strand:+ start:5235 stop:5417 length:183 start_codon:yes stop_codon:yes gene_type:complete
MIKTILNLIFGDEKTKIKKQIDKKYKEAINFQRNGNIRQYSILMNEISNLEDEYERLQNS